MNNVNNFSNQFNSKFVDRLFKKVDNMVWDLGTGNIGFNTSEGILSLELGELSDDKKEALEPQVCVNMFDQMGMSIPAFAQSIPVNSISLGDLVYSSATGKALGWVVQIREKSFKLLKQDGTRSDWTPPKVSMLGIESGVMILRSLFNMMPSDGVNNFQQSLMPMMMMGMLDDSDTADKMIPMLLMSQTMGGGTANPMAQMLPLMMMMNGGFGKK